MSLLTGLARRMQAVRDGERRVAEQGQRADQLAQRVDKHAERVLRDYRQYGDAMHR